MINNQRQQAIANRNNRLALIKSSFKVMPIMKKMSQQQEEKQQPLLLKLENTNSIENSQTNDSFSSEAISPDRRSRKTSFGDSLFQDNYTLLQKLGQGCNANVYKCAYKRTEQLYAVKIMKIEEENVLTLKRDFIILKELNHPSICRYKALYFDQFKHQAYLVMEYLPYPSLETYRAKSEKQLKTIIKEIVQALVYLHKRNLCHRDIKPQNILYNKEAKTIKLIDFGICKKTFLQGVRRDMLTVIGTRLYMAPEIFQGGGYDERIDLWSLGVTIYKLVAGRTPFESLYQSDMINKIIKVDFTFKDKVWQKFSNSLRRFVDRLLKKADQRITWHQAQNHIWFSENCKKLLKKNASFDLSIDQVFHQQCAHNFVHARAKEEGNTSQEKPLFKSIKLLHSNHYDLEESDDENSVVTPKTTGASPENFRNFSEFVFGNTIDSNFLRGSFTFKQTDQ